MALPDENPTYTKIDDDLFYLSRTTSEQLSATAIKERITQLQAAVKVHVDLLTAAAAAGVAGADAALADVSALSAKAT